MTRSGKWVSIGLCPGGDEYGAPVAWGLDGIGASLGLVDSFKLAPVVEESGPGFRWKDVRVGHWVVLSLVGAGKHNRPIYKCVSRCGVVSVFRRDALATGATRTCEACRPGSVAPPGSRVIPEMDLPAWVAGWEDVAVVEDVALVDEKSNLLSRKVKNDWDAYGRPAVLALIDRTALGRDFAWKVFVRDCHELSGVRTGDAVRIKSYNDAQRRIELSVRPQGGAYTFEVDLATGRTDRPFADIRRRIEAALTLPPNAKAEPAPVPAQITAPVVPAAPPPEPPRETILAGIDLGRLLKMRDGFDTLISVGRDLQTTTELKRELQLQVQAADATAGPLRTRYESAAAVARDAVFVAEEAQQRVETLNRQLIEAVAERDRAAIQRAAAHEVMDVAHAAYEPARAALEAVKRQLVEAEQLEAERVKTLGKADDLLPLLAALQKLSS